LKKSNQKYTCEAHLQMSLTC